MDELPSMAELEMAREICSSRTREEAQFRYQVRRPFLAGWRFIIGLDDGWEPGITVNRTFSAGAAVCSPFATDKIYVLDEETLDLATGGQSIVPHHYSISLDSQAFSYLEPYLAGSTSIPSDCGEVIKFIAEPEVNVDPLLYMMENQANIASLDKHNMSETFGKIKGYEVLRTIDSRHLEETGEIRSELGEEGLMKRAQVLLSKALYRATDDNFSTVMAQRQKMVYCMLLKMVEIQFGRKGRSPHVKKREFLEFMDERLATIFFREIMIACAYFNRGQGLGFFGKIQKKHPELFKNLHAMAWDLWHLRQMEENLTFSLVDGARYYFPAMLTFDKDFIEIARMYPLSAVALPPGIGRPIPFYACDAFDALSEGMPDPEALGERFFSETAFESREQRRPKDLSFTVGLARELEDRLASVAELTAHP